MTSILLATCLFQESHVSLSRHQEKDVPVSAWLSTQDKSFLLAPVPDLLFQKIEGKRSLEADLWIKEDIRYQSILGLGSSLEHSTCYNLSLLAPEEREKTLERIVHPDRGAGMNLMRICIGTPDFTASPWYTYNDCEPGQTDPELKRFSIEKDKDYVLPILKMALRINPELLFVASPWSPPGWMTTNDKIGGGSIREDCFQPYAEYLARFVEAYEREGIPVAFITPQNEPDYNPVTYPTCKWTGEQQRAFIRDHLGPLFQDRGIRTQIWCWDHNYNKLEFPRVILSDPKAAKVVAGTAFHHYEGKPEAMSQLQKEFPDHEIHFTEGSTFGVQGACKIIEILQNGAGSYLAWVTLIDHKMKPNPGPHWCAPTCIVLNSETLTLEYRFDYYMYAQFMKFIPRGAIRIGSETQRQKISHVAFLNPNGSRTLVLAHPGSKAIFLTLAWQERFLQIELPAQSVMTLQWGL